MKLLTLIIENTPVQLPGQINTVNNVAGGYGVNVIRLGINLLILFAVFSALALIIFGGFKWITSEGDKKKIEDARNTLVFSVVGLIIISLAFLVINVLGAFFKVPILTLQ